MNPSDPKTVLRRHAYCWGGAFLIPPIVMVILDLFDRDSPTLVALSSSMLLMVLYGLSHSLLAKAFTTQEKTEECQ